MSEQGAVNGSEIFDVQLANGMQLRGRFWQASPGEQDVAKVLLIVHGACEHGGRYLRLAQKAVHAGWTVLLPDLRGHGLSSGTVVHVDQFSDYTADLQLLLDHFSIPAERLVMVGCSMGGLISLRYNQIRAQQTNQLACRALFLLSPLLGIKHPIPGWKKQVASLVEHVWPQTRFRSTIDPAQLTHDQDVLAIRAEDSLLRKAVTARWYFQVAAAMEAAFAEVAPLFPETTLYQAGADHIVDPLSAISWARRMNEAAATQRVQLHILRHWYHELLHELQGDEFEDHLLTQIEAARSNQDCNA